MTWDVAQYGPAVAEILGPTPRLLPLGPGQPCPPFALRSFDPSQDLGPVKDIAAAKASHAGLWLYFDCLDESHTISQDLHTPEGSYWHALMHRREPDAWNCKYWFRKVGPHPVLKGLPQKPEQFVDDCERHRGTGAKEELELQRMQLQEWQLLFDWCFRLATR